MTETYEKVRLGKGKAALARRLPGGWLNIVLTGSEQAVESILDDLTRKVRNSLMVGTDPFHPNTMRLASDD